FHDARGAFLPMFFENAGNWQATLPVYAHALTSSLFGRSVEVARGTSAAISLLGAAAVGLTLKLHFRSRIWWAGPLLMAATPAWFLHSRTAFETVTHTALFASFIL